MHFIEKNPRGRKPLTLTLCEERETPEEYDRHAMNFSLLTENYENVAAGRCSVMTDDENKDYLYISAIYVEGNTNTPTKTSPNRYVGLGQLLVYSAIKYGLELNIQDASLLPVDDSQGFYLKMGFHPEIKGRVNKMASAERPLRTENGKLNATWINSFQQASFSHPDFRRPDWSGNIHNIHLNLRQYIMQNWITIG